MPLKINKHSFNRFILFEILGIFIFFLITLNNASGQNIGFGLKAGLNTSTLLHDFQFSSGDLNLNLNPNFNAGYHLGLMYRNRISKNLRIQAEPTYLKIGATYNESFIFRGFEFQTDSQTELYYIQMPIMVEITTTPPDLEEFPKPWEETTYHLSVGIYGGYLLDATFSGVNSGTPIGVDFEEEFSNDVTSQFSEFDAGFIIGGGFEYGYENKIGMETRFMLGILDSQSLSNEIKPNNLSISLAVYYVF